MDEKFCEKCREWKSLDEFNETQKRKACRKCLNEACRLYKQKNKEKISAYNEKYKKAHKSEIKDYNRNYSVVNRKTIQTRHTAYLRNRRKTNPEYKISCLLRNRVKAFLYGENRKSSKELLGCEYEFVRDWIESQFTDEMSFDNHGTVWHIDHVIPCAKFAITDDDEQKRCFNWTNLQPMASIENMSKGDNVTLKEYKSHVKKVNKYIKQNGIETTEYTFGNYDETKYISN